VGGAGEAASLGWRDEQRAFGGQRKSSGRQAASRSKGQRRHLTWQVLAGANCESVGTKTHHVKNIHGYQNK